eukprot:3955853-Pleurochrysis_carterae.AAC.3
MLAAFSPKSQRLMVVLAMTETPALAVLGSAGEPKARARALARAEIASKELTVAVLAKVVLGPGRVLEMLVAGKEKVAVVAAGIGAEVAAGIGVEVAAGIGVEVAAGIGAEVAAGIGAEETVEMAE